MGGKVQCFAQLHTCGHCSWAIIQAHKVKVGLMLIKGHNLRSHNTDGGKRTSTLVEPTSGPLVLSSSLMRVILGGPWYIRVRERLFHPPRDCALQRQPYSYLCQFVQCYCQATDRCVRVSFRVSTRKTTFGTQLNHAAGTRNKAKRLSVAPP
eukprot:g35260.t1